MVDKITVTPNEIRWRDFRITIAKILDPKVYKDRDKQRLTILTLKDNIEINLTNLNDCNGYLEELNTEILDLKAQNYNNIHFSLETYKEWCDENIIPTVKMYNFGTGTKQVHTIFAKSLKDEDIIRDFYNNVLKFNPAECDDADELILEFSRRFSSRYPTQNYYKTDREMYGKNEIWKTAKETIEVIKSRDLFGDCDDVMTLKYSCLFYMLQDYFPEEIWRLRGFIVDLWTGGGHAMLGWVKGDNVNDWIPIETTFYDSRQLQLWYGDYVIRNQILYKIRYSFDNKHEYTRI
jgi:hypothetical protein